MSCPVCVSQSFSVRSKLAVARRVPSGLKASETTSAVCPVRVCRIRPVACSRIRTTLNEYSLLRSAMFCKFTRVSATSLPSGLVALSCWCSARPRTRRARARTWRRPAYCRARRSRGSNPSTCRYRCEKARLRRGREAIAPKRKQVDPARVVNHNGPAGLHVPESD